LKATSNVFNLI